MAQSGIADVVCGFSERLKHLFVLSLACIVILLIVLPNLESGTGTYVITVVQIVTFGALGIASMVLLVACGRRS